MTLAQILPFLLTATTGPDNRMVLGVGASKVRRLGMAFGLGCSAGCLKRLTCFLPGHAGQVLCGAGSSASGGLGVAKPRRAARPVCLRSATCRCRWLGLVFTLQAALLFAALGWFAGGIAQWLQRRQRAGLWLERVSGVVFVGLGLRMALSR